MTELNLMFNKDNIIMRAVTFAKRAHFGQTRKYTGTPYIYHPTRVAARMMCHSLGNTESVVAAILHDVIEDGFIGDKKVDSQLVEQHFGVNVSSMVLGLTNVYTDKSIARQERKRNEFERLSHTGHTVRVIKLLDRIDNLAELPLGVYETYVQESALLLEAIGDTDYYLGQELNELISKHQLVFEPKQCPSCDGFGWYECGRVYIDPCDMCKGSGRVSKT